MFYGNTATPIHITHRGCFHAHMAKLSCSRDHVAHKAETTYCLAYYRESFVTPALEDGTCWKETTLSQCLLLYVSSCKDKHQVNVP